MLSIGRQLRVGDLLGRILRRTPLFFAVAGDVGVDQDPVQPGTKVGALPECAKTAVGFDHRLLQKILRVSVIVGHPQSLAVKRREQRRGVPFKPSGQLRVDCWLFGAQGLRHGGFLCLSTPAEDLPPPTMVPAPWVLGCRPGGCPAMAGARSQWLDLDRRAVAEYVAQRR